MNPQISFVIPLFNEESVFEELISRLKTIICNSDLMFDVVLVDDGSKDSTPILMRQLALSDSTFTCVFLSRNYGHQIALTAGLEIARGSEGVFVLDGDLQDPPELVCDFYKKLKEGYDVVYAIRKKRKEGFLKRISYNTFYRLQKYIVPIDIPVDSGDFSMMSRKVVDILKTMPEQSRFIRGMRAWIGLNQVGLEYERGKRNWGESKYSYKMLFKLAYNGIFNFTELPIQFITRLGLVTILGAFVYLGITLYDRFILGDVPQGFTGILFAIVLLSGVQLISIGVLGEYVTRIFFQTKERPLYIIQEKIINSQSVK